MIKSTLLIIGLTALFGVEAGYAAEWGPWEANIPAHSHAHTDQRLDPLDHAVKTFQKYVSPVDGARCPMYPTCSSYARQALKKHGPMLGMFMTADRLMHEGDPIEQQEPILKWGYRRFYDPLAYNDFWLGKSAQTD